MSEEPILASLRAVIEEIQAMESGINQAELAKKVNVPASTISALKNSRKNINKDILDRFGARNVKYKQMLRPFLRKDSRIKPDFDEAKAAYEAGDHDKARVIIDDVIVFVPKNWTHEEYAKLVAGLRLGTRIAECDSAVGTRELAPDKT